MRCTCRSWPVEPLGMGFKVLTYLIQLSMLCSLLCFTPTWAAEAERGGISSVDTVFQENCAVCHGDQMQGAPQGTPLVGQTLIHGDDVASLIHSISTGAPTKGMPAWSTVFDQEQIKSLALWVSEVRSGLTYKSFNYTNEISYSGKPIRTEKHKYYLQPIVTGLDPLPYSIAPLPDGSILVTEKMRGLRIISPQGKKSALITGTPKVYDEGRISSIGLQFGSGWLLDVAIHPDYANNGWVYLHHTDRCDDCNDAAREAKRPASMNRLIRGRIKNGQWVDEQVIWQAQLSSYTPSSDVAAGGRLAFDPDGFVFLSVGMKSREGLQDLRSPHGKILRLHDDGRIPADNPFVDTPLVDKQDALPSIWTYGHRSPQGLEFNTQTRQLWGTEHGPRGGDEVNLLLPGRNYGWPMFSKGQNYDGTEVDWGRQTSEVTLKDIEQPVVDMTPSPAISSFVIYRGDAFPQWDGHMLVGSLKAMDLFRVELATDSDGETQGHREVHREMIVENLARIRDIEIDHQGDVLLLLEHASGGQIARLSPNSPALADPKQIVGKYAQ